MPKGDAFNRGEVTSSSVTPESRWVVSAISGLGPEVRSPEEAAESFVARLRRGTVRVAVHDRESGTTEEFDVAAPFEGD